MEKTIMLEVYMLLLFLCGSKIMAELKAENIQRIDSESEVLSSLPINLTNSQENIGEKENKELDLIDKNLASLTQLHLQQQESLENILHLLNKDDGGEDKNYIVSDDIKEKLQLMERNIQNFNQDLESRIQEAAALRRVQALLNRDVLKLTDDVTENYNKGVLGNGMMVPDMSNADMLSKLQSILPPVYSILESTVSLKSAMENVNYKINQILDMNVYMEGLENKLITKKTLNAILASSKQNTAKPATTLTMDHLRLLEALQNETAPRNREKLPEDCDDVLRLHREYQKNPFMAGTRKKSGVYLVQPKMSSRAFFVYCDMETHGGGWTVFQKRYEGQIDFERSYNEYKNGFGNIGREFWLGLEKLHLLTNYKPNELMIKLERRSETTVTCADFSLGAKAEGYPISLLGEERIISGRYSGGQYKKDFLAESVGKKFNTNCGGGWWGCTSSLNTFYDKDRYCLREHMNARDYGNYYQDVRCEIKRTLMAIRPKQDYAINI